MRLIAVLLAVVVAGCQYPRDPEGTLERVRGGTLRVGVAPVEPWEAVERQLISEFARTLDARIEWVEGSESELMEALAGRQLDVVIAGLDRASPWMNEAALTRPYVTVQSVIGAPDRATAERLSDELGGERIAAEANSPEAAKLETDTDAVVVPVDQLEPGVAAAVEDYLLDDLGLVRTDAELDEHEHAMAVSMGENAMLVTLERFLLDREAYARELLEREGKP
ncbi:transporter substrate-binding domain-containing protein [Solirubrobacter sp. CPCC 204708]|uniref:Transporter substrate-binding domain-containing protein n=1 Tax=Solirubrobacter deserti TaxID=2282478 RepID=A0ABT4RCJ3_9ACTN|nr:transporter substrate-binding domain-containing protein [Solirubrobacter deserti]MBE2315618.1 transporter substrate-binding domain-containing protein [Solirubrobacter deserti]MDA0136257.1 transporter substrate-binding domain-containing protein [Solirubrobacter deserti]